LSDDYDVTRRSAPRSLSITILNFCSTGTPE
jgi:hypothetical protein